MCSLNLLTALNADFHISDDRNNTTSTVFQGVTFKVEGGELIIARILHGGMIDQQGLLHVGDIIKEVR